MNITRSKIFNIPVILLGAVCYTVSVVCFIAPGNIPLGGVTGLAVLLGNLFGWPAGGLTMLFNVPLFLLSWRRLGRRFLLLTLGTVIATSLLLDILKAPVAALQLTYNGDHLLAALYGGVLGGLGLGLIFSRGATSGGVDILAKLVNDRYEHLSIGRINLVLNGVVILISAAAYRSVEAALYALVVQYVTAVVTDGILVGMDNASAAFIVTTEPQQTSDAIMTHLHRGVTALPGTGMYSKEPRVTLLCAVRRYELTALKKIVLEADPSAFIILTGAREVLGLGFKEASGRTAERSK